MTVLARKNPRDLITSERLEIERHFNASIHGHHLFPRAWARRVGGDELYGQVDRVVNVAALTSYANAWIGGDAPEEYIDRLT